MLCGKQNALNINTNNNKNIDVDIREKQHAKENNKFST